jgi:hypothetical protein
MSSGSSSSYSDSEGEAPTPAHLTFTYKSHKIQTFDYDHPLRILRNPPPADLTKPVAVTMDPVWPTTTAVDMEKGRVAFRRAAKARAKEMRRWKWEDMVGEWQVEGYVWDVGIREECKEREREERRILESIRRAYFFEIMGLDIGHTWYGF